MVKSTSLRVVSDQRQCGTTPTSIRHSLQRVDRSQKPVRMNRTKPRALGEYTLDMGLPRRAHPVEAQYSFLAER